MRICIIGDLQDLTSTYMLWLAQKRGLEVIELPEDLLGASWTFAYTGADANEDYIEFSGKRYPFSFFCGAVVRLNPQPGLPPDLNLASEESSAFITERRYAIQNLLNSLPFTVANRPCSGRSNGSKPYQMSLLTQAGFTVPRWIVSNEVTIVEEFLAEVGGTAIYKSCSGMRSKVRLVDDELIGRLQLGTAPVIVQEYIKGFDVRVHVVGNKTFATKVISHGVDYRFDSGPTEFQETSALDKVEELCRRFAQEEYLTIAGFDFRVSENGHWFCLEANPVPTFLPYEMATGQAIGNAILDLFASVG